MKLNTRVWGTGDRLALLVHGIMSDSRTWRRVGPALAARGYRVIGVDLRGHGESGRAAEDYSPAAYAADLVETAAVFGRTELALGHSLGGLALVHAVDVLRPAKAVYADPAWHFGAPEERPDPSGFIGFADNATAASVSAANPRWAAEDVEVELATFRVWDRQTALRLPAAAASVSLPERAAVPSLVLVPADGSLVGSLGIETLEGRGFEVRRVAGVGHTMHRDDHEAFMTALDGWI